MASARRYIRMYDSMLYLKQSVYGRYYSASKISCPSLPPLIANSTTGEMSRECATMGSSALLYRKGMPLLRILFSSLRAQFAISGVTTDLGRRVYVHRSSVRRRHLCRPADFRLMD